jgi:seryl-tRNA synthetase
VSGKVQRFLAAMLQGHRPPQDKVYLTNVRRDPGPLVSDVCAEMRRRKWLFEIGQGHIGLSGPVLRLSEYLNRHSRGLFVERFTAAEYSFPALIRSDILTRCGYFESHPNNTTLVTHLIEDFDLIEEFRQSNATGVAMVQLPSRDAVAAPHTCLNPAACFPVYYTLEDNTIPASGTAMTFLGRVFRYESKNMASLERLWEFNVRELVFVGGPTYILQQRDEVVQLIGYLGAELDLDMQIQTATDPFFATVSTAKKMWQQSMESKYEIRLTVGHDGNGRPRTIAAGSVNVHGTFFGERFAIKTDAGQVACTGCLGLGIERFVYAAFTQHGFDAGRWPTAIAQEIFSDRREGNEA